MNWKVESEFKYAGYKCIVIMVAMGHRCGYVGIPKDHPLYGLDYSDKSNCLKSLDVKDMSIENASVGQLLAGLSGEYNEEYITPEMYFSVHGGITYAGGSSSKYPIKSDLWWFGFDCAHSGDGKDLELALEYGLIDNNHYNSITSVERTFPTYDKVKSLEYCIGECKNLAEQLSKIN